MMTIGDSARVAFWICAALTIGAALNVYAVANAAGF